MKQINIISPLQSEWPKEQILSELGNQEQDILVLHPELFADFLSGIFHGTKKTEEFIPLE